MATLATIVIKALLDAKGVEKGTTTAQKILNGFSGWVSGTFATALSGVASAAFAGWGIKLATEVEQAKVAFEVLLGSASKAESMLSNLKDFARSTPFTFRGLQESAQLLLSFGVEGENVLPILKMLGDVSGGNAEKMSRLALAFGQMSSTGRLMGQDLLQMVNAGFNPLQEVSKRTGETMAELKKRMEAGGISANEVAQAFMDATGEGGRFNGMMDRQAQTIGGQWEQLKGLVEEFATQAGEALMPLIGAFVETAKTFMEILIPASRAFLDTLVAMLMPTEGMPDIWEQVAFGIELAGAFAVNLISVLVGGWRTISGVQNTVLTTAQILIVQIQTKWNQFWGKATKDLDKELNRLEDWLLYYTKDTKRGLNDIERGFTGEAGQEFVDRLNKIKQASANASKDVGGEMKLAATAAAETLKVAFKDVSPAALERGSSAAASAVLKAQRDADGNRTEKAMLKQLEIIAKNSGGQKLAPANI